MTGDDSVLHVLTLLYPEHDLHIGAMSSSSLLNDLLTGLVRFSFEVVKEVLVKRALTPIILCVAQFLKFLVSTYVIVFEYDC